MPNINNLLKNKITKIICKKCNRLLDLSEFNKNKDWVNYCKDCDSLKLKDWRKNNPEKHMAQKIRRRDKYLNNPELMNRKKETTILWKRRNPKRVKEYGRKHYKNNKNDCCRRFYDRIKGDNIFRFKYVLRSNINDFFKKRKIKKDNPSLDILGCSWVTLIKYIEDKFKEGMNWSNYGGKRYNLNGTIRICWEIDHIIYIYTANIKEDIIRLNHYTNLQPLWWWENAKKGKNFNLENVPIIVPKIVEKNRGKM